MIRLARRYSWWFVAVGVLTTPVVAAWSVSQLTHPVLRSLEDSYSRIRVGMSRQEAIATLERYDPNSLRITFSGTTRDGRSFASIGALTEFLEGDKEIPPALDIETGEIFAENWECWSVTLTLGQGGIV